MIERTDGSDGKISCVIKTEPYLLDDPGNSLNAIEFEDYVPKHETVIFENGENSKVIPITITNERVPKLKTPKEEAFNGQDEREEELEEDANVGVKFTVILEKPVP